MSLFTRILLSSTLFCLPFFTWAQNEPLTNRHFPWQYSRINLPEVRGQILGRKPNHEYWLVIFTESWKPAYFDPRGMTSFGESQRIAVQVNEDGSFQTPKIVRTSLRPFAWWVSQVTVIELPPDFDHTEHEVWQTWGEEVFGDRISFIREALSVDEDWAGESYIRAVGNYWAGVQFDGPNNPQFAKTDYAVALQQIDLRLKNPLARPSKMDCRLTVANSLPD